MRKIVKKVFSFLVNELAVYLIPPQRNKIISVEDAERILNGHSADPGTSPLWENEILAPEYDLSIIIPVYNVEKYLDRCMQSVMNQVTEFRYQVIVINDGSTDQSASILEKYSTIEHISIITQENKGFSGARNTGLRSVRGRYVMFVDSDDYLTDHAVQSLIAAAYALGADIVQGGYFNVDGENESILSEKRYKNDCSVPPNGVLAGMAWGKVYKANLFEKVCFPEVYWFEDTVVTGLLTHLAVSISTVSDMVYNYRRNNFGITRVSVGKPKSIDAVYVQRCIVKARRELGLSTDKAFYEHMLRMSVLTYQRTMSEPDAVRRSIFVLMKSLLEDIRGTQSFPVDRRYRKLEKSIIDGDYAKYSLISRFHS